MQVNRSIRAVAALVLCGMMLGGCKDDWGDRASAFVDDDLPHLSRDLAKAEPKRLRYRLLHVAGRLAFHARTATLHLPAAWPWASQLAAAFTRLAALPAPA